MIQPHPTVEQHLRAFLKAFDSSGGQPLEALSAAGAPPNVLVDAQASMEFELPPCDIEERKITQDGIDVRLTIVRPQGLEEERPVFMFFHGGGWILGDFPDSRTLRP